MEFTRVNNNSNGNPRYVVHFLAFIKTNCSDHGGVNAAYRKVLLAAKKIHGRKYHNKYYGGGIAFTCYNTKDLEKKIIENQI